MNVINIINHNQVVLVLLSIINGLIIGSFLNVLIHRIPTMLKYQWETEIKDYLRCHLVFSNSLLGEANQNLNLAFPSSHCPKCKHPIPWSQNVPVLSYIILKGKCANCRNSISVRYPIVEIISCLATLIIALHYGITPKSISLLILTWGLITASFIDLEHQIIPDCISLPLIWIGLLVNSFSLWTNPQNAIIGTAIGYLSLFSIAKIFKLIRKINGMGNGDFKLLAVFGAWFGWKILPNTILLASLIGIAMGITLLFMKKIKQLRDPIPFGPCLATAGWIVSMIKEIC